MSKTTHASISATRRRGASETQFRLFGNWQIECLAAKGTLTNIYFARPNGCSPDWPADYALKLLKPTHQHDPLAVNLLKREAAVGTNTSNSHLLPILESNFEKAPYFVVMPKLNGASLGHAIAALGRVTVSQALWITRQICEALREMHRNGWIHADVKPSNVVVSSEGHATLLDFGCALRPQESLFSFDRPVVGTLHYIAPEMVTSQLRTDCRCDIYSLGVSLFEMLCGRLPFTEFDQAKLVEAHLKTRPPNPRELRHEIPVAVADLVMSMMAKDPLDRPQSANELINILVDLEIETLDSRMAA